MTGAQNKRGQRMKLQTIASLATVVAGLALGSHANAAAQAGPAPKAETDRKIIMEPTVEAFIPANR